jgi:iron(III) transport system substrate-binding protein
LSALLLLGLGNAAHAQSASWEDTVAKAKQEGTVVLYGSGLAGVLTSIQTEFAKAYGIKVEALMVNSGPQRQRVSLSIQAKQVQVDVLINNDTPFLNELQGKGDLADISGLPNKSTFPHEWWDGAYPFIASFSQTIFVNTDHVDPKTTTKWADLLDPKYKDKVVTITPAAGLGVMAFFANIIDSQGPEYLKKLGQLNPVMVATSLEGSQLVASGEKWIYFDNVAYNTVPLKAKGAPVDDLYLPPVGVVAYGAVALAQAPHPNAAKVLINWMLSHDGQEAICGQQRMTCSLPGIPDALPLAAVHKIYDPGEVAKRQEEILAVVNQSIGK